MGRLLLTDVRAVSPNPRKIPGRRSQMESARCCREAKRRVRRAYVYVRAWLAVRLFLRVAELAFKGSWLHASAVCLEGGRVPVSRGGTPMAREK